MLVCAEYQTELLYASFPVIHKVDNIVNFVLLHIEE